MTPALFLDRDGVINQEKNYVHRKEDFEFIEGVFEACRQAREAGYQLVIITNQAGIARGFYTEEDFHSLTDWMLRQFSGQGVTIDGVYFCPHHPTAGTGQNLRQCDCRKPAPGLIRQAVYELDIDLASSVIIGDKHSDMEAGRCAGVGTLMLVRSGHPLEVDESAADVHVASDLAGAVRYLLHP